VNRIYRQDDRRRYNFRGTWNSSRYDRRDDREAGQKLVCSMKHVVSVHISADMMSTCSATLGSQAQCT